MSMLTRQKDNSPTPTPARLASRTALVLSSFALVAALAGCTGLGGGAAEIPSDFPKAVSVPEGTVTAADTKDAAWTVNMKLDKDDSRQTALEKLTAAGFSIIGQSGSHGNDRVYSLANADYSIRLGVTTVDGNDVLSYTVAKRQGAAE